MGDFPRKIDVKKLISYSNDLVQFLNDKKDVNTLSQCLRDSEALHASCNSNFDEVQSSIQDYEQKIDACKRKTDELRSEIASDAEIDLLEKELEEELQKERLLREELRMVVNEISDLEHQRISIDRQREIQKKLELDDLREWRKFSMYACVTNIIPDLDDKLKVSGCIVERDARKVERFEFDPAKVSSIDDCIWKMISPRETSNFASGNNQP